METQVFKNTLHTTAKADNRFELISVIEGVSVSGAHNGSNYKDIIPIKQWRKVDVSNKIL